MTVVRYELQGKEVEAYLIEMAGWLHKDFVPFFTKKIENGQFFALAPEGLPRERLLNFKTGGLTLPGREVTHQGFRLVEKQTLEQDFAQIFADIVASRPTLAVVGFDALIDKKEFPDKDSLDLNQKPFGILDRRANSANTILEFINDLASAWTTVILIVDQPIKVSSVKDLAAALVAFAVTAYDGESFVFWSKLQED